MSDCCFRGVGYISVKIPYYRHKTKIGVYAAWQTVFLKEQNLMKTLILAIMMNF